MSFDPDALTGVLELDGPGRLDVWREIAQRPQLRLETSGASTLTVVCVDVDHQVPALAAAGITAAAAGRRWELAAVKRVGGRTVLVFEDDVVRALRVPDMLSVPAGSTTVNELATRLTRPRGVAVVLEPTRQTVAAAFAFRGTVWAALGDLGEIAGRWRYSDGQQLVLASPAWLLEQPGTVTVVEDQDGYGAIDYDLHSNKPIATAAAGHVGDVPAVGTAHRLDLDGPAAGDWLVGSYSVSLGDDDGRITWVRPTTW